MTAHKDPKGSASFPVPLFLGRVRVCITRDAYNQSHQFFEGLPYKYVKDVQGVSSKHLHKDGTVYLVGIFSGGDGTLVHELVHTATSILAHSAVPFTAKNDEALAYLMDSLFVASKEAIKRARR